MKAIAICFSFAVRAGAAFLPCGFPSEGTGNVIPVADARQAQGDTANSTPAEVFDGMRKSFRADKARGVHVSYQFKFTGPNGGDWWIVVTDGAFKMGKGTIEKPDVTFASSDKDWVALSNGTLGGTWAFISGRLKITGSKSLAGKLGDIFP